MNFIWKIENFGCIKDHFIVSPSFSLHSKLWEVHIYPHGYMENDNNICLEIKSISKISLHYNGYYCSFGFLDFEGSPLVWHAGKLNSMYLEKTYVFNYRSNFIRNDILRSRKGFFLPNNVLTIECYLWQNHEELAAPTLRLAHSRIDSTSKLVEKTYSYTIEEIKSLGEHPIEECLQVTGVGESCTIKPLWNELNLTLKIESTSCKFILGCQVSLLESSGKEIQFENGIKCFFANGQVWQFETGIFLNLFLCQPMRYSHLMITCTILDDAYWIKEDKRDIRKQIELPNTVESQTNAMTTNAMTADINDMQKQEFLCDFKLRVGEKEFNVHKAVLGARSTVFRAMFTPGMKETENGYTDIKDVDAETLRRLLDFIYADKVEEDMDCVSASRLYVAADKYAVIYLKRCCSSVLGSNLCVENAIYVLLVADKHGDGELKSTVQEFISRNDKEIVGKEKWNKFEEENMQLAFQTLRKLYKKKMEETV